MDQLPLLRAVFILLIAMTAFHVLQQQGFVKVIQSGYADAPKTALKSSAEDAGLSGDDADDGEVTGDEEDAMD